MKKILINIVMVAVVAMMIHYSPFTAYAKTTCAHEGCDRGVDSGSYCRIHKCGKSGCNREKGNNGTIYCSIHASEYVVKEGYTTCSVSGCMKKATRGIYCSSHACMRGGCNNKRVEGSNLCAAHGSNSTTAKFNYSSKTKSSSSTSKKKTTSSYSSSKKNSTKSSTKKKYDQYDVYNYKSAQDFADDKYEEFFDYEDDYDDEDEAYDAAEDYWNDRH